MVSQAMEESSLKELRALLKSSLMLKRGKLTSVGYRPVCAICNQPIVESPDMHEAILTRGDVQGSDYLTKIMVKENCVLVHTGGKGTSECHALAHTKVGRRKLTRYLIDVEGLENIKSWLKEMDSLLTSGIAQERLRMVQEVFSESTRREDAV